MMVEAAPATALVVAEADFLLQFLVVAFDPPALHGVADQRGTAAGGGQRREPEFGGLGFPRRPFDQAPFLGACRGSLVIAVGGANTHSGKAGGKWRIRTLAPGHPTPGALE